MADYLQNRWITFLRHYGPIPKNDNMYDETIQRACTRAKMTPIKFSSPFFDETLTALTTDPPSSVILTGTAGDGKTYVCREIWMRLGGEFHDWDKDEKVVERRLPSGRRLVILKDLSKLNDQDLHHLETLAQSVSGTGDLPLFLVAANDGLLIECWNRIPASGLVEEVRDAIEDALVQGRPDCGNFRLLLFNVSRRRSSSLLPNITQAVLQHEGWKQCQSCPGASEDPALRCPIIENVSRLREPSFQARLGSLMEACDHNGYRLPIRQLLLLIANALLGHPDAREQVMSCAEVPVLIAKGQQGKANIYRNIFGMNLHRRTYPVFEILAGLGIGDETNNHIDNLLTFGHDDPTLNSLFNKVLLSDSIYGANSEFLRLQDSYLGGEDPIAEGQFLEQLTAQRQRLFFVLDPKDGSPWDLSVFQYGGEFLQEVLPALQHSRQPPAKVVERLIRGLNRVFTGMLTKSTRHLWLSTGGDHSQARVSALTQGVISVDPDRGQRVMLRLTDNQLLLSVQLDREAEVALALNLIRYEFLSRVAEGALPSSFSRECYEDILSFKSRLLARFRDLEQHEPKADHELRLRLLDTDRQGELKDHNIRVVAE